MRLVIDVSRSPEQNAAVYYELAKKARKKLEGLEKAIADTRRKIEALRQRKELEDRAVEKAELRKRDRKWFEKFRWFVSSEGFLVVGGRDATSNEIVVKKHAAPDDVVFHTDLAGSPFFVVKCEGKQPGQDTLLEAAVATASFSRAWRLGLSVLEVFHARPEQVSKKTRAGEYMGKGSFMIYGKTEYLTAELRLAVGLYEGRVMCAPEAAVRRHCSDYAVVVQGRDKSSDVARVIRKKLGGDLDSIIAALPSGGCRVKS
ncbi:DUF814 domain-containing protein [Candidatus Woesearchaeota archaeon]|nr:DUF814 domain-containing protein [Candidatus Woesearchaeota archaeon]